MSKKSACKIYREISKIEMDILKQYDHIDAKEAKLLCSRLSSIYIKFIKSEMRVVKDIENGELNQDNEWCNEIDIYTGARKKYIYLKEMLEKIINSDVSSCSSEHAEVNNCQSDQIEPSLTASKLDLLLQKQKLLSKLIQSLEPNGNISAIEAEVRYKHLNSLYDMFMWNESEIMMGAKHTTIDSMVLIAGDIQAKVISLETKFKKAMAPEESQSLVVNDHSDRGEI